MSPLVRASVAAAVLAAFGSVFGRQLETELIEQPGIGLADSAKDRLLRPCPPGTLLDNQVCVPAPDPDPSARQSIRNWQVYDRLPRRPDRPARYDRYILPVEAPAAVEPSPFLEEGQVAGDALLLRGAWQAPVRSEPLEHQQGPSRVLYTGKLVGRSVVTEHRVEEPGGEQTYLVILGNLDKVSTRAGALLKSGETLGSIGHSASRQVIGLHLEIRRVRHGVDARELGRDDFRARARTVACDARNVYALAAHR